MSLSPIVLGLLFLAASPWPGTAAQHTSPPIPAGREAAYVEARLAEIDATGDEARVAALLRLAFPAVDPIAFRGELAHADELYARLRDAADEALREDRTALGELLTHATRIPMWREEYSVAEEGLRQALRWLEPASLYGVLATNALAICLDDQGRVDEALASAERACAAAMPKRDEWAQAYALALNTHAVILSRAGRGADATAVRADLQAFLDDGAQTDVGMRISQHEGWAMLNEMAGRYADADEHFEAALDLAREQGGHDHIEVVRLLYLFGTQLTQRGEVERAVELLEEASRRHDAFVERHRDSEMTSFQKSPWRALAMALATAGRADEALAALERHGARTLRQAHARAGGDPARAPAFDRAAIQATLEEQEAVVAWLSDLDHEKSSGFGLVLRKTGPPRWVPLPGSRSERDGKLERLWSALAEVARAVVAVPDPARVNAAASALYGALIAPVDPALAGVSRLIVLPSPSTDLVPLAVLVDGEGRHLADRFEITYQPSASFLAWQRSKPAREGRPAAALLVADPPYQVLHRDLFARAEPDELAHAESAGLRGGLVSAEPAALPRLAGTRSEVLALAPLFGRSELLLGLDATVLNLTARAPEFPVVHVATHGRYDRHSPSRSALYFACAEDGSARALSERDVRRNWRLDAELVTLSACATGRDQEVLGGEEFGFPHAFLTAGARSVVATAWVVDDRATALFMRRFYGAWLGADGAPVSRAEALRLAGQALREHEDRDGVRPYAHPYFWGAFVLFGDGR